MIATSMTAMIVDGGDRPGGALVATQLPTPQPGRGEILIAVRAAGINRADLIQRMGLYPPPTGAPDTLGLEVAGEVALVGEGVTRWKPGDRVVALLGGGGYAQYAIVDARHALPLPRGLDYIQGAALPEAIFTVWANVFEHGGLRAGDTFLVHGATSGIGVTAVQMAKVAGARVIATARGAEKAAKALRLGADLSINTTLEDFEAAAIADGGVDVILDMVGGPYFPKNLQVLKVGGRLVHIAAQAGEVVELPIRVIMAKRLVVTGSTIRSRDADEKARLANAVEAAVWPWIEASKFTPIVDQIFQLVEAEFAHDYLASGEHVGKLVLTI